MFHADRVLDNMTSHLREMCWRKDGQLNPNPYDENTVAVAIFRLTVSQPTIGIIITLQSQFASEDLTRLWFVRRKINGKPNNRSIEKKTESIRY